MLECASLQCYPLQYWESWAYPLKISYGRSHKCHHSGATISERFDHTQAYKPFLHSIATHNFHRSYGRMDFRDEQQHYRYLFQLLRMKNEDVTYKISQHLEHTGWCSACLYQTPIWTYIGHVNSSSNWDNTCRRSSFTFSLPFLSRWGLVRENSDGCFMRAGESRSSSSSRFVKVCTANQIVVSIWPEHNALKEPTHIRKQAVMNG